jgi:FlaA1/EpsC-like NDP-sugar epimerase
MGEPVNIYDLAKKVAKEYKTNIQMIGMRKGEKLFEELSYDPKTMQKTDNEMIFKVNEEKKDTIQVMKFLSESLWKDPIELRRDLINLGYNINENSSNRSKR